MTDTPTPFEPKVVPLDPSRPSAAPLGPQADVVDFLEKCLEDARSGKAIGAIIILMAQDGSCFSNVRGAFTFGQGIAQLELFKTQLALRYLQVPSQGGN